RCRQEPRSLALLGMTRQFWCGWAILVAEISPAQLAQIFVTVRDAVERDGGLVVFDDVILDTRFLGMREDALPIDDAAAHVGHVFEGTAEILSPCRSHGGKALHVFDVDQREA